MIGKYTIRDTNPETSLAHREVLEALHEYRYAYEEIFDHTTDITFDDFVPTAMLHEVYRRHIATKKGYHYSMPILTTQEFSVVVRECFGVREESNITKGGQRGIRCMKGPIIVMPKQTSVPADWVILGTKICRVCKRRLPRESFPKRYGKFAWLKPRVGVPQLRAVQPWCKDCRNDHQRYMRQLTKKKS